MKQYALILLFVCALRGMDGEQPAKRPKLNDINSSVAEQLRAACHPASCVALIKDYELEQGEPMYPNYVSDTVAAGLENKSSNFKRRVLEAFIDEVLSAATGRRRGIKERDLYTIVALLRAGAPTVSLDIGMERFITYSSWHLKRPELTYNFSKEVLTSAQEGNLDCSPWLTENMKNVDSVRLAKLFVEHGARIGHNEFRDYHTLCEIARSPYAHELVPWFVQQLPSKLKQQERQFISSMEPLSEYIHVGKIEHASVIIESLAKCGLNVSAAHGRLIGIRVEDEMKYLGNSPEEKIAKLTLLNNFQMTFLNKLK